MSGLLLILPFIIGLIGGAFHWIPVEWIPDQFQSTLIIILLFLIGISVGSDEETLSNLTQISLKSLLVPAAIFFFFLFGGAV